jgi:ABC-type uncharacterized transport system ATPase subunit
VTKRRQDYVEFNLTAPATTDQILQTTLQRGGHITLFELAEPSLNDIFIERVGGIAQPDVPVPVATSTVPGR